MNHLKKIFFLAFLTHSIGAQSQEKWTLQKCVEYAWENSIAIQQSEISYESSRLTKEQAYWAQYPSANMNVQQSLNIGRSIDLTTNQFVNQVLQATSISLSASMPIYNGFQIRNTIRRTRTDMQASEQDLAQAKNTLSLSVAQAYLTVVLAEENVEVLKRQMEVTQAQYDRTQKLITAGVLPENNRYDLEAQLARDEQNIVTAENSIALGYLSLKVLMNMNPTEPLLIEHTEIKIPETIEEVTLDQVFKEAATTQPNILAARLRQRSAELQVKIAKGALQPTLSAFMSLATNFSSTGQYFTGDTLYYNQTLTANVGGNPVTITIPQAIPERAKSPYFRQLGTNFRQAIGLSLQVPIFNAYQARTNVHRAELNIRTTKLNINQIENQLKSDIQRAITDVKNAQKRLAAAEKTLTATELSVQNTQKRFELGVVNGFEYTSVQNSLVSARSNLLQARYDYIFKLKVLDFYRGKSVVN